MQGGAVFHHHMLFGDGCDAGTGRAEQGQVETGPRRLIGVPVDWT